jgi:putative transposase
MKRSRFTEEQIIAILKEQKAGAKTADVCRRHGISDANFYNWKAKYGGLEVPQTRRLKALEDENARCKQRPSGAAQLEGSAPMAVAPTAQMGSNQVGTLSATG